MASIDQQFVEYIVKTLVSNPDRVEVDRKIDEKGVLLSLTVDPEDVGRVIGRRGVTAQAIRVLLRALGTKQNARFNLKIVNSEEPAPERTGKLKKLEKLERPEYIGNEDGLQETDVITGLEDEEEEISSVLAEKTRAELADYDDLDI